MKNFTILTHWASKCASICTINKNRYYLFIITMLFTLGVGSMWGETITFTNSTLPTGWSGTGSFDSNNNHYHSNAPGYALGSGKYLQTAEYTNITSLTFWGSTSNAGDGKSLTIQYKEKGSNTWNDLSSIALKKSTQVQKTVTVTSLAGKTVSLKFSTTWNTAYLDDIEIVTASQSHTITAISNNDSYGTVSLNGTKITASPKTGYRVSTSSPYTISPASSATVTQNGNTFTVAPTANTTITINFEAIPTYTVNWYVNGTVKHTQTGTAGTTLTNIPQPTKSDCDNSKVFVGWVTSGINEPTNIKPDFVTPTTIPSSNTDYYAVFATLDGESGGSGDYKLVTSLTNLKSGEAYLGSKISYSGERYYYMSSTAISSNLLSISNATVSSNILQTPNSEGKINLVSTGTANQYYIKNAEGKYLYSNAAGSLSWSTTACSWTFSNMNSTTGLAELTSSANSNIKLRAYGTSTTQGKLKTYSGTTNNGICVFLAEATTTYSDYITTCTTETSISLYPNFGSELPTVITTGASTYEVPPCSFTRTGYTFSHWDTKDDDLGVNYEPGDNINLNGTDVNLHAIWTPITYTINYELDGGTNHASNPANYTIETETITLQNPSKQGCDFVGWYKESTFATQVTQIAKGSTGNITLYAKWEVAKTATSLTWSAASYVATIDADNTFPTLTKSPADLSPIAYSSSNTDVATIDANGNITLLKKGETTITATFEETATHTGATASYTLTVHPSNCRWVETEIGDIDSGDEVVITMTTASGVTYALPSEKFTSGAPNATSVKLDGKSLESIIPQIVWIIYKNGDNLTFESNYNQGNYLAFTNSDTGVRVNDNTNRNFVVDDVSGYLMNTQTDYARYLGVHNTNHTWYSYKTYSVNTGAQTLKFYKRECLDASKVWVEGNLTNVTCDTQLPQQLAKDGSITLTFTAADGYELPNTVTVENATNSWNQATGKLTISNPTDNVMVTVEAVKYYTVTWKPAGGNWSGDTNDKVVKYEAGDKIVAPATPTYDCHEFLGWTPAYPADMTMPAGNLEFTATWNKLSYTITFKNYDGTVLQTSTVECGETPTYTGAAPTREQTAQYTYTFKGWSPTIASVTQDQVYTAQFTQTTRQYTVTWYDGTGNAHKTQSANYNATISVPTTDLEPCDDAYPHFIGWTADPIVGSTTTQPTLVENVKVTGDCDYYAVFAKGEGGSSDYKLVTSAPADWSGTYLIVNTDDKKAWKGSATSDNGAIDVTITNNTIPSNATTDNETFTIATMTGGYSIKGTSGKYIYGTSGSNATNYNDAAQLNTISIDNNNNVTITSNTSVLRQNNSNASLFRYYKSSTYSSQHPIQLYKKGSGVNYTSFITTCCTSWSAPTLTYATPLEENGTTKPQITGTTHGIVTYESSNPSILSVNSTTGEITAKAPGAAKITATWSGDATYCSVSSTSNVITVKGSFSVIYYSNGGTGTMANQKADEDNVIAQLNDNQFTRDGYAFVGWNTTAGGTGTAYADQATNITLTQNLTLYAQWAAIVTLNDAGNVTTTHPETAGGSITLEDGANACDPYEFVGWTTVATGDWNEGINEPALVATTYTPNAPTTLYAVYKIQSEGNANAFKLSFEGGNGKTYYVGEYGSSPYLRGYSNITEADAVTFIRKKMYPNDDTKYYLYLEHLEEYLYCSSGNLYTTSSEPSESQGWVFHTIGDKIQIQAINQEKYLSYSDRDDDRINITTHSTGGQESFNMLSAVTSTYVASPLCNQEIEIIFETGNGNFVANAPATNPLTVSRGDVITLPTCEYPGYEFMGWLKDEQQLDPSDIIGTYYTGDYTVDGVSSTITFYAYYKVIPEEVEFTGKDDVELLMYYYDGTENYYYAVSHAAERGELSSKQNCFNATTWTFTNVGNMQYHIQDETGKYLGAYSDGDNDLILSATPKVWTFTEVNGLWKMVCENSPSRALMYISEGNRFTNAAITNEGNGAYSYVTLGICPYPTYTTNPVLTQGFVVTNTAMVTSAFDQKVKAASALTLETRNIELPCTFTISAPNITFYDTNGNEITQLTSSAASEQFELYFAYKPTAENTIEYPTVTITDDEMKTYTIKNRIYARSLPNTFAVVAKVGGIWYALPSQGLNSTTPPAAYPVEVDNMADPTAVAAVPANADWSLRQVYVASRVDATKDRFVANGENLVFVNNEGTPKALNASASGNYLLTDAQYSGYYETNPGLYEWTPTTSDLETYTLTNAQRTDRTLNVSINTVFGVHYDNKATTEVRFLPIQNRYTPMAAQVVEWKANSVVVMYNGDPAQTASVSVNGGSAQTTTLSSAQKDIAVYELTANGLATNPTQSLSITIGTEKAILPIPYIVSGETTDLALLPGDATVAARQEVAKVADLVVLKDAKLTADGAKGNPYKFRNVTIYGGGSLVIPSDKGFGANSLTMRVGGVEDGEYVYTYPQLDLNGTINSGNINLDLMTTYDYYYPFSVPYEVTLTDIHYPVEIYGSNVKPDNKGSFLVSYYDGEARSQGNTGWKDVEEQGQTVLSPHVGYSIWGLPKKVSVNGATSDRQTYGIHRIPMKKAAGDVMDNETKDQNVSISAYNATRDNDKGWNFIGNPYLVQHGGLDGSDTDVYMGLLVKEMKDGQWTGGWGFNGEQVRYVTQTNDCLNYTSTPVANAAVPAFSAFFIQAKETGAIAFTSPNVAAAQSLTARRSDENKEITTGIILSGEKHSDRTGLLIADQFTEAYEFNADLSKFDNQDMNLYTISPNGKLAFMAINEELAKQTIPLGYSVSADGMYTIAFDEQRYNRNDIYALYLIDYDRNETTNLLHMDYDFYSETGASAERFALQVAFAPSTTTDIEYTQVGDILVSREGNTLQLDNLPNDVTVTVYDAVGHLIEQHTASQLLQLTLQKGYYLLHIGNNQHFVVIDTFIP